MANKGQEPFKNKATMLQFCHTWRITMINSRFAAHEAAKKTAEDQIIPLLQNKCYGEAWKACKKFDEQWKVYIQRIVIQAIGQAFTQSTQEMRKPLFMLGLILLPKLKEANVADLYKPFTCARDAMLLLKSCELEGRALNDFKAHAKGLQIHRL